MSNNPRPGYKLTKIGEIPEDWEVVEFSKCFTKGKVEVGNMSKQNHKDSALCPIIDQVWWEQPPGCEFVLPAFRQEPRRRR